MNVDQALVEQCFLHFYGLDVSNAAIHCADVRFSPITFRLSEALDGLDASDLYGTTRTKLSPDGLTVGTAWHHVQRHHDAYAEDRGR